MKTKKIHYGNSTPEQKQIIENRIQNSVVLASCLVEKLLEKEVLQYDEIENFYEFKCPECGRGFQDIAKAAKCCKSKEEPKQEPQEIFEWWIITDEWLLEELREIGEPVIESDELCMSFWGRTCTGQSISLDPTFWNIFQDSLK